MVIRQRKSDDYDRKDEISIMKDSVEEVQLTSPNQKKNALVKEVSKNL